MEIRLRLHRISILWLALSAVSFGLSTWLSMRYMNIKTELLDQAEENARRQTDKASRELNSFISILKPIAENLAEEIASKNLTKQQIIQLIKKKKPVEVSGLGVAFLPHEFSPDIKLFSPYYFESNGKNSMIFIEKEYDYTKKDVKWFYRPINKGAGFSEPYYGPASKTIIAEYSVPIFRMDEHGKKHAVGVVYANQSVEHLNHILDTLFLSHTGYWSILTKKGIFLAHPQGHLVHKQISIFDLAKQMGDNALAEAGKKIINKENVFLEYNNEITGAPSWLFSAPLEGTDWSILGIFDKGELDVQPDVLRQNLILPSLGLVLFIIMLTFLIFSLFTASHPAQWILVSGIISVGLIMQIIWVWYAASMYPHFNEGAVYPVQNKASLYSYLQKEATPMRYGKKSEEPDSKDKELKATENNISHSSSLNAAQRSLIFGYNNEHYIPTGIFINNVSFIASNAIQINAFIWQRLTTKLHENASAGFILPQATDVKKNEISRVTSNNTETILWEVHATLNQQLGFDKYPFDAKNLTIQIWPIYSTKNNVLVPDLDSYQLINPRSLPGIDDDTFIPGWNIFGSKFSYKKTNYTSNFGAYSVGPFGIYNSVDKSEVPELYFEVQVTRNLVDTLVSDLLPIAVIAVLLFMILLTRTTERKFSVIGYCASVFFATVFAQIRFRSKIPQAQIVYFESFYFLMYAMILVVLITTVLYQLEYKIPVLQYRENIISKLLYWPLLFSALSIITMWYLY